MLVALAGTAAAAARHGLGISLPHRTSAHRSAPATPPPEPPAPHDSAGWSIATARYPFSFPRDHAAHPDYATEWWYYTGHLTSGSRRFGFEVTFFRVGLQRRGPARASRWAARSGYFVHVALTDVTRGAFRFGEDSARPALGLAGSDSVHYHVWVHEHEVKLGRDGVTHELRAHGPGFVLALALKPARPPVVHGPNGVSWKSATHASHYYSITRLAVQGRLVLDGRELPVGGLAWMDHEFFTGSDPRQAGWDWFSIQLDDGRDLMLYRLRRRDGSIEPASSGTLVERDGHARALPLAAWTVEPQGAWRSPATHANYPEGWRVRVPGDGIDLTLAPVLRNQEVVARMIGVTYWEGSVGVRGTSGGRPIGGAGYVEMTGYAAAPGP